MRQKAVYFQQASDHRKKLELRVVETATIREKYLEQLSTLTRDVSAMRRDCDDECILESFILLNLLREATLAFGDAVETWHFDFTRVVRPQLFGTDYMCEMLSKQDILTTLRTRKLFKFQFSSGNILLLPIHYAPKSFVPEPPPPKVNAALAKQMAIYAAVPIDRVVHFYRMMEKFLPKKLFGKLLPLPTWFNNQWIAWDVTPPTPPPKTVFFPRIRRSAPATSDVETDEDDEEEEEDDETRGRGRRRTSVRSGSASGASSSYPGRRPTTHDGGSSTSSRHFRSAKTVTIAGSIDSAVGQSGTSRSNSRSVSRSRSQSQSRGGSMSRSPSRNARGVSKGKEGKSGKAKRRKRRKSKKVEVVEEVVEEEVVVEILSDDDDLVYLQEIERRFRPSPTKIKKESEDKIRGALDPIAAALQQPGDSVTDTPTDPTTATGAISAKPAGGKKMSSAASTLPKIDLVRAASSKSMRSAKSTKSAVSAVSSKGKSSSSAAAAAATDTGSASSSVIRLPPSSARKSTSRGSPSPNSRKQR